MELGAKNTFILILLTDSLKMTYFIESTSSLDDIHRQYKQWEIKTNLLIKENPASVILISGCFYHLTDFKYKELNKTFHRKGKNVNII